MTKINGHFYSEKEICDFLTYLGYIILVDSSNNKHAVKNRSTVLNNLTKIHHVLKKYYTVLSTKPSLKKMYIANAT